MIRIPDSPLRSVLREMPCAQTYAQIQQQMPAVERHAEEFLAKLDRLGMKHSIQVITAADSRYPKVSEPFNCFEYAFNLAECDQYHRFKSTARYASSDFVKWLVRTNKIREQRESGSLIVYWENDTEPVHAGKACLGGIISKWSYRGPLLIHAITEIEPTYGTTATLYFQPSLSEAMSFFEDYLKIVSEQQARDRLQQS